MKIQFLVSQKSGSSYHRLINPISYLQIPKGWSSEMLWIGQDEYKIDCDILYYNKFITTPIGILKKMKEVGMKIVLDMDDLWELPVGHVNYQAWKDKDHSNTILEHIKMADVVICSSELLQDHVRVHNQNTVYIPNAFPYGQENYLPRPIQHEKIAFMYMGGVTHLPDVELFRGKFKRIGSDPYLKKNSEFVLAGYDTMKMKRYLTKEDRDAENNNFRIEEARGEYDKMLSIFADTGSYRVLPATNLDDYINYYDQADVALCPLVDSYWNRYKSVLKVAEAGCKEIPIICSKVSPYYPTLKDCPGIFWLDSPGHLIEHIKYCVKNPVAIIDKGKELGEYCRKNFHLQEWNKVRMDIFNSLV